MFTANPLFRIPAGNSSSPAKKKRPRWWAFCDGHACLSMLNEMRKDVLNKVFARHEHKQNGDIENPKNGPSGTSRLVSLRRDIPPI